MTIMHQNLHMFLYKIQTVQAQTPAKKAERLAFCKSTTRRIKEHSKILDLIFFRDEAHFHLSGQANKQNMRFSAQTQPAVHVLIPLSMEKVTVWCDIECNGIIGPYWSEDDHGHSVTENTERYVQMMLRKFIAALR